MRRPVRIAALLAALVAAGTLSGVLVTLSAYFYFAPTLPDVDTFRDVKLQVPLRIFTRDGRLIAEFGDKRRIPVTFDDLPQDLVNAFISAEDDRYFQHPGVDYQGLIRAVMKVASSGGKRSQGGSTITMQLARNIFLTRDKTYTRKIQEIFLALKMEREFSKQEILALYLNKIFLGQRAYGVGAAAEVYFGKSLNELTLGETAVIAGLPQAPSSDNPVRSPERARSRRDYVLRRLLELGHIDRARYDAARAEPIEARLHGPTVAVNAPYMAEMARAEIEGRFGREAINEGYRVITSLDSRLQREATTALRMAMDEYDRRHGWRGAVDKIELDDVAGDELDALLRDYPSVAALVPAVVQETSEQSATVHIASGETAELLLEDLAWARRYLDDDRVADPVESVASVLSRGDVVFVERAATVDDQTRWRLAQLPDVQGALVAVDPRDGAIVSLQGGYDFFHSKFNRVTQAKRQPGSAFKPFVYSAALEFGLTPATLINDAPVVFQDSSLEDIWRPKNYSGRTFGPTRLREALVKSRNLVSIRLLNEIGIGFAINHLGRFGFDADMLPRNLSLALGSAAVTPLEMASAYAVFANGGFAVEPYFIDRIENSDGETVFASTPLMACEDCLTPEDVAALESRRLQAARAAGADEVDATDAAPLATDAWTVEASEALLASDAACQMTQIAPLDERHAPRVLSAQNAFMMSSMMQDVVRRGTGARVSQLGRGDLAGKTGTTNDHRDAWFSGFNRSLVATTWIGFDRERPLGRGEAGASVALPGWMAFMREALDGVPERFASEPKGLVTVRISPDSGLIASADAPDSITEIFRENNVPARAAAEFGRPLEEDIFDDGGIF